VERVPLTVDWSLALNSIQSLRARAADINLVIDTVERMAGRGWSLGHPTDEPPLPTESGLQAPGR